MEGLLNHLNQQIKELKDAKPREWGWWDLLKIKVYHWSVRGRLEKEEP